MADIGHRGHAWLHHRGPRQDAARGCRERPGHEHRPGPAAGGGGGQVRLGAGDLCEQAQRDSGQRGYAPSVALPVQRERAGAQRRQRCLRAHSAEEVEHLAGVPGGQLPEGGGAAGRGAALPGALAAAAEGAPGRGGRGGRGPASRGRPGGEAPVAGLAQERGEPGARSDGAAGRPGIRALACGRRPGAMQEPRGRLALSEGRLARG
mmetsp:Transcript_61482/g.197919  ORF Transcript_61482/g.197919 Transcript_61482/m.197919 type:complete len:207 (+) Transcript_61482:539-1159(+)